MIVIRRPFVWMLGAMVVLFLIYRAMYSERDDARYFIFQGIWEDKVSAAVTGHVERTVLRRSGDTGTSASIYLKNCKIQLNTEETVYSLKRLLVYTDDVPDLEPGNELHLTGILKEFSAATNPGQFDQREYYREKGIYYQFQAQELTVVNAQCFWWKSVLCHFRDRMAEVYGACLPQKEAGVVTAMILGDKSLLDLDIKTLYQQSGIGHLLAISGLHVTILGMAFYRLLRRLGIPVKYGVPCAVAVLLCYGSMTDFSISTSRAVIMMILSLMADWIGRTYDRKSALAFSGIVILLQKPFALFSCSFLLSFGAIAGIELLLPVFQFLVYGDGEMIRERRRRIRRRDRELRANYRLGEVMVRTLYLRDKIISMFLASLSVQLATLPVMLYFYYEIPLYGIFINLLVIPLASFVVLLSFLGGMAGCVILPLGEILLGSVYYLLQFYEWICRLFQRLPGHMQILGCPAVWKILVYYGLLFLACAIATRWKGQKEHRIPGRHLLFLSGTGKEEHRILGRNQLYPTWKERARHRILGGNLLCSGGKEWARHRKAAPVIFVGICCITFFFAPVSGRQFQMAMLDVGQGDGIFIHTAAGQNILVDGGSTSVSEVGTYRILPFLKYSGVRDVDYLVMTHCDEDHMNGLLTVLEESGESGPVVKNLVVPDVADKQAQGYQQMVSAAEEKEIPVIYLSEGYVLQSGELSLTCLNPVQNFRSESANAGSITLSLLYRNFSCLLTGDLEGDGQEHVKEILENDRKKYHLPDSYTVLKVAHHGSKNSSDEDILRDIAPQISLISCGKKNRYGHPHGELLERLEAVGSDIFRTDQQGAIFLRVDKGRMILAAYLS